MVWKIDGCKTKCSGSSKICGGLEANSVYGNAVGIANMTSYPGLSRNGANSNQTFYSSHDNTIKEIEDIR